MKSLFLLFAISMSLSLQASWIDSSGKTLPDTQSMRSDNNFGVRMILTPDDKQFRQVWVSSKNTPKIATTDAVKPGSSIAAVLIFHGCSPDISGMCDVVSKFYLESPDGTIIHAGGGPVWSHKPLANRMLQLGRASVTLGFGAPDSLGQYKVIAHVKDRVSGRQLKLISIFTLTK